MRYKLIIGIVFVTVLALSLGLAFALAPMHTKLAYAQLVVTPSPSSAKQVPTVSPRTNSNPSNPPNTSDSQTTIIVAIITLIGTIIVAIISTITTIHIAKMQNKNNASSVQTPLKSETEEKKLKKNFSLLEKIYWKSIAKDKRFINLKILDMPKPLNITEIYVPAQVDIRRNRLKLSPAVSKAQEHHDPNAQFTAHQQPLEKNSSKQVDQAINESTMRCLILSDIAAGKTMVLRHLILESVNQSQSYSLLQKVKAFRMNHLKLKGGRTQSHTPKIPIYIELNEFAKSPSKNIIDFAAEEWNKHCGRIYGFTQPEVRRYFDKKILAGEAMILLDGLDETMMGNTIEEAEEAYKNATSAIGNLAANNSTSGIPIVLTARKATYLRMKEKQGKDLNGFHEWELQPFHSENIEQFLNNWIKIYPDSKQMQGNITNSQPIVDLKSIFMNNLRIRDLATNPLLLSLIIMKQEWLLPDNHISQLYKECVKTLLTQWDINRNINRFHQLEPPVKEQLLRRLAWYFHTQGKCYFSYDDLLREVARFLSSRLNLRPLVKDAETILNEIIDHSGLLKEYANDQYGFLSLALQEYFVAQYAATTRTITGDILRNHKSTLDNGWWDEVILLCGKK